jgi:hypothetical protein
VEAVEIPFGILVRLDHESDFLYRLPPSSLVPHPG